MIVGWLLAQGSCLHPQGHVHQRHINAVREVLYCPQLHLPSCYPVHCSKHLARESIPTVWAAFEEEAKNNGL